MITGLQPKAFVEKWIQDIANQTRQTELEKSDIRQTQLEKSDTRQTQLEKSDTRQTKLEKSAPVLAKKNYDPTASVIDMLGDLGWETLEIKQKQARPASLYTLSHNLIDVNTDNYTCN